MSGRSPFPYKRMHAREWIQFNKKLYKKSNPKEIHFAVDIDGNVIGSVGFMDIEKHKAEIGYWIGKKYWNKGIITEALKLITNFGFKKLKLRRIYATIFVNNVVSAHILKKNGYKFEGKMKNYILKKGKLIDIFMYAKIK